MLEVTVRDGQREEGRAMEKEEGRREGKEGNAQILSCFIKKPTAVPIMEMKTQNTVQHIR